MKKILCVFLSVISILILASCISMQNVYSIEITALPDEVISTGTTIEEAFGGIEIKVNTSDGEKVFTKSNLNELSISGFNTGTEGEKTVSFGYLSASVSLNYTVVDGSKLLTPTQDEVSAPTFAFEEGKYYYGKGGIKLNRTGDYDSDKNLPALYMINVDNVTLHGFIVETPLCLTDCDNINLIGLDIKINENTNIIGTGVNLGFIKTKVGKDYFFANRPGNVTIKNCSFHDCPSKAIEGTGVGNLFIDNCSFINNGNINIDVDYFALSDQDLNLEATLRSSSGIDLNLSDSKPNNIIIKNSYFENNGNRYFGFGDQIKVSTGGDIKIKNKSTSQSVSLTIENCEFTNSSPRNLIVGSSGGAINNLTIKWSNNIKPSNNFIFVNNGKSSTNDTYMYDSFENLINNDSSILTR